MTVSDIAAAFGALKQQLNDGIRDEAARLVAEGPGPYSFKITVSQGAIRRGAFVFENDWGGHVDDLDGDAGITFSLIHALGETATLRRVKLALTDPRSRGKEVAVMEALTDGLEVEEAIQRANRPPPGDPGGSNVIPLHRK
jgi:hypothetical protein